MFNSSLCPSPCTLSGLVNIFLTHKHMKSKHIGGLHSWKGQVNKLYIETHSICILYSLHLLYSIWASEHILRFPIFQAITDFLNDILSFFRDRQWNQKVNSMGKIMVSSYSEPCLHSSLFLWGNEFQWFISSEPCLCTCISWDGLNWPKTNVSRVKN